VHRAAAAAFGGIGAKPWRTEAADAAGKSGAKAVAAAALEGARTTHHNAFKTVLVERTLASIYRQKEARA
jgi:xanthine dehydrogenase YagS FAD-binding subunit